MRSTILRVLPATLLLLVGAAGCGKGYQRVQGKVTFEDGAPLTKGMVVFEGLGEAPVTARGDVGRDGSYRLGTDRPGDGVPPGKYRVLITPLVENPDAPERPAFDPRYTSFATSGLEFEVKAGQNDYPIQVSRAEKGRR